MKYARMDGSASWLQHGWIRYHEAFFALFYRRQVLKLSCLVSGREKSYWVRQGGKSDDPVSRPSKQGKLDHTKVHDDKKPPSTEVPQHVEACRCLPAFSEPAEGQVFLIPAAPRRETMCFHPRICLPIYGGFLGQQHTI